MKYIAFLLTVLSTVLSLAQVPDLEMGAYKLTSSNSFLNFTGLNIGYNNSIVLNGDLGGEALVSPGCVGTYKVANSVMTVNVLCPPNYFFGGLIELSIDLNSVDPKALYSSAGQGATAIVLLGGSKEHQFPFEIKYVYPAEQ